MTLRLTPYLVMDGNAKEAIQFYEKKHWMLNYSLTKLSVRCRKTPNSLYRQLQRIVWHTLC